MKTRALWILVVVMAFTASCGGGSSTSVTIDLSGAQALFTVSQADSSASQAAKTTPEESLGYLRKILADGTIQPVIYEDSSGNRVASSATPNKVFVGMDGKIYIVFGGEVLANGEPCFLVRGTTDGPLECFDSQDLFEGDDPGIIFSTVLETIDSSKFDSQNNFYYKVQIGSAIKIKIKALSTNGIVTDKMSFSEVGIHSFAVAPDGTLFFKGQTGATGDSFFRRSTPEGGVANMDIDNFSSVNNFIVLSDGDLFVAASDVLHYTAASSWSSPETIVLSGLSLPKSEKIVTSLGTSGNTLCEDTSGNVYLWYSPSSQIFKIYPGTPVPVTPSDENVTLGKTSGNFLYYAGTDSSNKNIFKRIDLTDPNFQPTDLIGGADIEVYRLQVWSNGNILFGGLRLSDNQLILGEIDGTTLDLTVRTTTTTRIDELVLIQ